MKILQVHNEYRQRTGEHRVVTAERAALRAAGHTVTTAGRDNRELDQGSPVRTLRLLLAAFGGGPASRLIAAAVRRDTPDVAHVHNVYPLLTPQVYRALAACRVPIVQTVHNFRFWCPCGTLYHRGRVCEAGVGKPWIAVRDRCFRHSAGLTGWYAMMTAFYRRRGAFAAIDTYIAPSAFVREKMVAFGIPADRVVVKPHFLPDTAPPAGHERGAAPYALFVGRLDRYKGVQTLIESWRRLADERGEPRLHVIGGGPLEAGLRARAGRAVRFLGAQDAVATARELAGCRLVVVPSECYETFGLVVLEAFRAGKPVVASRIGALPGLVEEGRGGLLFEPGNAGDLARAVSALWNDSERCAAVGRHNRHTFEQEYTQGRNVDRLVDLYTETIARARTAHADPRCTP